jgi:hypothetical protein
MNEFGWEAMNTFERSLRLAGFIWHPSIAMDAASVDCSSRDWLA